MSKNKIQRRTYDFNNISVDEINDDALNTPQTRFSLIGMSPFAIIFFFFIGSWVFNGIFSLFLIAIIISKFTNKGSHAKAKENAYRYYKLLKSRESFSIEEVSYFMNLPVSRVQSDLQYLFDNNILIPNYKTVIYDSRKPVQRKYDENKMYRNASYTINKVNENYKQDEKLKSYTPPSNTYTAPQAKQQQTAETDGNDLHNATMAYIQRIRAANDAIPGEAMSAKIDELEKITLNIYNATLENKELLKKTKKFMSYYLPTTEKLICKYAELDNLNVETENTIAIKKKIEESLGTITKAFYELYDDLYDYDAIDITSEIEAFKNALVNDGLLESGLKISDEIDMED